MQIDCCPVCQSGTGVPHAVREMLRGTGEGFVYFECSECGCLSLSNSPREVEQWSPQWIPEIDRGLPAILRRIGAAVGVWPSYIKAEGLSKADLDVLRRVRLTKDMALLDVSSGAYMLMRGLRKLGYDAHAADPEDIPSNSSCWSVTRDWFENIGRKFDVILFRHSLERLPVEMLASARNYLHQNGCCVACIALTGWAWHTYGTDWVQLHAHRHRVIHSNKSFSLLALKSGFRIDRVVFDSTEDQIWASDTLQRNVPLSKMSAPRPSVRARMRRIADALNRQHQGDSAQFYLRAI